MDETSSAPWPVANFGFSYMKLLHSCESFGPNGGDCEADGFLGYDSVSSCRCLSTFLRNRLSPSYFLNTEHVLREMRWSPDQ
jgi:hypothetical protein